MLEGISASFLGAPMVGYLSDTSTLSELQDTDALRSAILSVPGTTRGAVRVALSCQGTTSRPPGELKIFRFFRT